MPTIFPTWPHIVFGVLEPISLYVLLYSLKPYNQLTGDTQSPGHPSPSLRSGRLHRRPNSARRTPSTTPQQHSARLPTRQPLLPYVASRHGRATHKHGAESAAQLPDQPGARRHRACLRHVPGDGMGGLCRRGKLECLDVG